ncbi:MAG: type II toxin-antitoxin system VapC family toxin [Candidatus Bathyarchaeia archaeon]|jgi:predicted nucleic acid-binding protein
MRYLFDSSAIIRAIKENNIDLLTGNGTLEIARYELGNIVWKDYLLQAKISKEEARSLMNAIKHALNAMEIHQIVPKEEEILETSGQFGITFYDASYTYFAKSKASILVTEDLRLTKKIAPNIKTLTLDEIAQNRQKNQTQ